MSIPTNNQSEICKIMQEKSLYKIACQYFFCASVVNILFAATVIVNFECIFNLFDVLQQKPVWKTNFEGVGSVLMQENKGLFML